MKNLDRRNKYFFGLGTIGRDMFYAFEANALLYFLSNILSLPLHVFAAVSLVLSVLRIADALTDPWGEPLRYEKKGKGGRFNIYCSGPDGEQGTEDDLTAFEDKR